MRKKGDAEKEKKLFLEKARRAIKKKKKKKKKVIKTKKNINKIGCCFRDDKKYKTAYCSLKGWISNSPDCLHFCMVDFNDCQTFQMKGNKLCDT